MVTLQAILVVYILASISLTILFSWISVGFWENEIKVLFQGHYVSKTEGISAMQKTRASTGPRRALIPLQKRRWKQLSGGQENENGSDVFL